MQRLLHSLALAMCVSAGVQAEQALRPGANLVIEGIPPVPLSLVEDVKRYTEARFAGFGGWHPRRLGTNRGHR